MPQMNELINYTVHVFESEIISESFYKWYKEVFSIEEPNLAGDFEFSVNENVEFDDIKKVIEVQALNPYFSLDALFELFKSSINVTNINVCKDCVIKQAN